MKNFKQSKIQIPRSSVIHSLIAVAVVPLGEVAKVRMFLLPEHTVKGHRSASSRQLVDTALSVSARPVKIFYLFPPTFHIF